jgi:hypothetical protein
MSSKMRKVRGIDQRLPVFLFLVPHRADKARGGGGGGGGLGGLGGGGFGGRDIAISPVLSRPRPLPRGSVIGDRPEPGIRPTPARYLFSLSCKAFTASSKSWTPNCSPFTAPLIWRITTACSSGFMSCHCLSSSATFVSPHPVDGGAPHARCDSGAAPPGASTASLKTGHPGSRMARAWMAATNKCLAKSSKCRTGMFKSNASPVRASRMWTLASEHHEDRTPRHGYAATREAATAAFAKSWRRN